MATNEQGAGEEQAADGAGGAAAGGAATGGVTAASATGAASAAVAEAPDAGAGAGGVVSGGGAAAIGAADAGAGGVAAGGGAAAAGGAVADGTAPAGATEGAAGESAALPALPIKSDAQRAIDVEIATTKLLQLSGVEASVAVTVEGDARIAVFLDVKKGSELFDAAAEGQVLESIEYLAMKIAGRDDPARLFVTFSRTDVPAAEHAIAVDPATEGLGAELAAWVVRNERPLTLLGVPSTERKGLHAAMNADGRVTSRSEGEGAGRRMVVSLRRGPAGA
jgi:predicted RNA-binding protein Jag